MRISDLADAIAPQAERKITGMHPGEKVNEIFLTGEEAMHAREFDDYYVIEPEFPPWMNARVTSGKALPEGLTYTSDNNNW